MLATPYLSRAASAESRIVLASYGGTTETFMRNVAIPSFERETGIKVTYAVGTALSNYSRVLATRSRPEIDVYWANDISHIGGKSLGLYAKLDLDLVPNLNVIDAAARDPEDVGVTSNFSCTGLQYNARKFADAGFAPPTSWLDLWDPKFKGRVALYSIGVLFSQDFLAMLTRILGGNEGDIGPAIRKLRTLRDSGNVAAFANSPAEMDNVMVQGQAWIGINGQTRTLALVKAGSDIAWAQTKEGGALWSVIFDVVKGGPNPKGAQTFVNHMLRADIQSGIADAIGYAPVNPKATIPPAFASILPSGEAALRNFVALDRITMNDKLDDWTEQWTRQIETRR